ncbi:LOW QUALITY PROTEIN: Meckel syndrome type 1 protein [Anoplophora glabripennis]|uniref:LOW QUALITY PROTEIN: Meckel syndrome type 1 protein n=1 Tax=Anoplophora glabripennis TaxID=217634 RepID=UPI000C769F59|nr:LOW QUALITY PROTEIN: Meckel syndrome type 1 protein [Anoplophora glabripennis]
MASVREKLTKYTAYYRCPDNIQNFKMRIKYKEIEAEKVETADGETEVDWQIKTISWQEKHFSKNEREFYGDALNCVTDLEKRYHEQIKDQESPETAPDIFTFTEEDGYTFEQELFGNDFQQDHEEFDYNKHLQSSMENKVISSNVEKMYIMADLGEYVENIWIKNEQLLCSIKYDKNSQVLNIYPDFTTIKPYYLKMGSETIRYFFYFIENCSKISEELVLKEQEIIKKISEHKQSIRQRLIGNKFPLPPKNKLYVYLFLEILSAKHFEYPDVYIEYYIDLPEGWSCENSENLRGRTQTSHGITDKYLLHFGHCVDVVLQYNIQKLSQTGVPKTPYIYFEIISKGTWDRYRTEGLTYKILPISEPGHHIYNLSCFRFTQGAWGDLRRFFIGDCKNYKDVTWIGIPKEHEGVVINKFGINTLGTGELNVRVNVVHQSQAFLKEFSRGDPREKLIYEKLNSSSLIKSVEEVLHAFRKARKNMLEVRKNL